MMMQMLEAAGVDIASDRVRRADADNRRGYYELEAVKGIREDTSFFEGCVGKAVKVVAPLLPLIPSSFDYCVLFMDRGLDEVLASQHEMLRRLTGREESDGKAAREPAMERAFQGQINKTRNWMDDQPNLKSLRVSHRRMLAKPIDTAERVVEFLKSSEVSFQAGSLDGNADSLITQMAGVVDPDLSRQSKVRR
jgi:hypothetical protein